jgi:hypothetical protein
MRRDRELRVRYGLTKMGAAIDNIASGPVAQLGARFHGMEEVIGSIPIRSTNQLNNLAWPTRHKRIACVMVCVITGRSAAFGEDFHRRALRFQTYTRVPLQHLAADVSGNRHDGAVSRPALRKGRDRTMPEIMEPESGYSSFLCQRAPRRSPAIDVACWVVTHDVLADHICAVEVELWN